MASKVHNIYQGPKAEPSIIEQVFFSYQTLDSRTLILSAFSHSIWKLTNFRSLEKLNLTYIDLMLIHWPGAMPVDWSNPLHNMTNRKGTWEALEKYYSTKEKLSVYSFLLDLGKLQAIGVSNWMRHHLEDLLTYAKVI